MSKPNYPLAGWDLVAARACDLARVPFTENARKLALVLFSIFDAKEARRHQKDIDDINRDLFALAVKTGVSVDDIIDVAAEIPHLDC